MIILLRTLIIAICMCLMLSGCNRRNSQLFRPSRQTSSYFWLKVAPQDKGFKASHQLLLDKMSSSSSVRNYIDKTGLPDYIFVPEVNHLYLAYIKKGYVVEFKNILSSNKAVVRNWRTLKNLHEHVRKDFRAKNANLMLILDSSSSMGETDNHGNLKIDIAKNVISNILDKIPTNTTNVSLMSYNNCSPVMLVPTSNSDLEKVRNKAMGINPSGKTPIAKSIESARSILINSRQKETKILLISDGIETCGGDPCSEAKELRKVFNKDVKVYSVGYSVDKNTREQLQCISSVTGGKYFDARDSFALDNIVHEIIREEITKEFDRDGDGIINEMDECPNTLKNFSVDEKGCETYYTFKINFDHNSAVIKSRYITAIKELADYMKSNKENIQLQGHTDSTASNYYNKKLSDRRAKSVMRKLIQLGTSSQKLSFVGYGEERPITSNTTSWGRFKNRRVEAHIMREFEGKTYLSPSPSASSRKLTSTSYGKKYGTINSSAPNTQPSIGLVPPPPSLKKIPKELDFSGKLPKSIKLWVQLATFYKNWSDEVSASNLSIEKKNKIFKNKLIRNYKKIYTGKPLRGFIKWVKTNFLDSDFSFNLIIRDYEETKIKSLKKINPKKYIVKTEKNSCEHSEGMDDYNLDSIVKDYNVTNVSQRTVSKKMGRRGVEMCIKSKWTYTLTLGDNNLIVNENIEVDQSFITFKNKKIN